MATYNVVTDLGADDTGSTAIDSDIESNVASGDTLFFPAGDYLLNDLTVGSSVSNFTLQGEPGATLIPKDYGDSSTSPWIQVQGPGFGWHQFEIRVNGRNPGTVDIEADDWELTRLITRGEVHCETDGEVGSSLAARTWFSLWVPTSGAHGLIEDCYFQDGSNQSVAAGSNRRAILIDGGNGDITINRCWFEQWGENTIYAKHPVGRLEIFNSYWRNTQNGARTGGNTTVRNCVSICDGDIPRNWDNSAIQRGVAYEASGTSTGDRDQYSGTHTVRDCDFNHDYRSPPGDPDLCGAAIGGGSAPERAVIRDCRIYYNSDRSHDAIYNGKSPEGDAKYWELNNVHVDNDCSGSQYCVDVVEVPNSWGPVSGVLTAENGQYSNNAHVRNEMVTGGFPDAVDTTPPLPEPPAGQPMANATVVTIDNTGTEQSSTYSFEAVATSDHPDSGTVHPSGVGDSTIVMPWVDGSPGRRAQRAETAINPGITHRYYIADGDYKTGSFSQTGDATLTVTGGSSSGGSSTASTWQNGEWVQIDPGDVSGGADLGVAAMKRYDADAGEWVVSVPRS